MRRNSHRQGIQSAGNKTAHFTRRGIDERQRAGQNSPPQFRRIRRVVVDNFSDVVILMHVRNERIVVWPSLDSENTFYSLVVEGVRAQSVHRLGGNRHDTARKDNLFRLRKSLRGNFFCFRNHNEAFCSSFQTHSKGSSSSESPFISPPLPLLRDEL